MLHDLRTGAETIVAWLFTGKEERQLNLHLPWPTSIVASPDTAEHQGLLRIFEGEVETQKAFTLRWGKGTDGAWRITRWELKPGASKP